MVQIPLRPWLQGARSDHERQLRQLIADYANHLLANTTGETRTLYFGEIAIQLGAEKHKVNDAIGEDGGNGLFVRISPSDRAALELYKSWPLKL
jgi:hypothetical protein